MHSNKQRPLECFTDQEATCHTERPFRRQFVYCTCLGEWITQNGANVIPWTLEAPTKAKAEEGARLFFPNRPTEQLNLRKETDVADSRWIGHF